MGKPSDKKQVLTIDVQKKFLDAVVGYNYEKQHRFVLQTRLRTGELMGLKWSYIDFENKTMKIERTMEYHYKVASGERDLRRTNRNFVLFPLLMKQSVFWKTRDPKTRI